jgi:serine/threonine-protein kinase HipA
VRKLHQEDFCQILRVDPERKYEFDGGPGLRQCARVVRRHGALPAADLERLARWVAFNYLIGNEDAHAKNLAFLYRDEGLALTPHYDLVSTLVYPGLQRRLAMKIGGATDIRNVQRKDWRRFATALGLPASQVREWLLDQTDRGAAIRIPPSLPRCFSAADHNVP